MISTSFRAHDVIVALVAMVEDALPGVQVIDGPRRAQNIDKDVVLVGYDPLTSASAVATRSEDDLGARMVEEGEIALFLGSVRGNGDMVATRDRVVEMFTAIEAALRDSDLDGSCDEAQIGPDMALTEAQTDKAGAQASISASVQYRAWI